MEKDLILEKQDLTYLKWSHIRSSSGTAGTFLKSQMIDGSGKTYFKLSNFDPVRGVVGHECVNELIVDRLLTRLGVEHLPYTLIYADIEVEGRVFSTYLCASKDFKARGESKIALEDYYRVNSLPGESHYDFCVRNGWQQVVDTMLAVDFLILNRDRHGANIEILRNARAHTLRPAPLFDHGLSLLYACETDSAAAAFDVMEDKRCQNYIGGQSCLKNLELIRDRKAVFSGTLKAEDRAVLMAGLEGVLSKTLQERIWEMIYRRYLFYEGL